MANKDIEKIDEMLNEKFGFTKMLPSLQAPDAQMHSFVTDRNGRGSATAGGHPMEEYRNHIKALLGALSTEDQGLLENAIDWNALKRLANKHGLKSTFTDALTVIQTEFETKKPDLEKIKKEWETIQDTVPFWFLGMVGKDIPKNTPKKLPEDEKEALTNLKDVMDKISQISGKEFKRASSNTPDDSKTTQAEKNIDKIKKDHKMVKPKAKKEPTFPEKSKK